MCLSVSVCTAKSFNCYKILYSRYTIKCFVNNRQFTEVNSSDLDGRSKDAAYGLFCGL